MFRVKQSIPLPEARQGYIYYAMQRYAEMPQRKREIVDNLIEVCGGEYANALLVYLTTDESIEKICMRYYVSRQTLFRCARKFYMRFPTWI